MCENKFINYCDKSVNKNETPTGQNQFAENNFVNHNIDVDIILKKLMIL